MIKQPVTDRAADQQKKIENSLMGLMTSSVYTNISVSDICRHAQIPRRTFYYYYDSKDAVLESIMTQLMDMCDLEIMFSDYVNGESLEYSLCCFYEYWGNQRRDELTAFITSELEQRLMSYCLKWINSEENWRGIIDNYRTRIQEVSRMLGTACVFYTLFCWARHGFRETPTQLADYTAHILANPIYEA